MIHDHATLFIMQQIYKSVYALVGRVSHNDSPVRCRSCGPGSSVGIATDYGVDGPGIESRWGEIFRPSRPALGPTQPPVQWVSGLYRGQAADHSSPFSAAGMEE
jgi:hypothetical protein